MFNDLDSVFHTIIFGSIAYVMAIILLRISGKRTLSKWNAFDFVVTIAFGSILASTILSKGTSLLQGVMGFFVLIFLQFLITWLSVRSQEIEELIKAKPTLLLYKGQMQYNALKQERVTEGEVLGAIRANGVAAIEEVEAVVLETDGSFSVIKNSSSGSVSALLNVKGYPTETARV